MNSNLSRRKPDPDASQPGLDLLRSLAGQPIRSVHVGRHRVLSRVVLIERDAHGNIIGSTERYEESEFIDLEGDWLG
jgi:hypothetical protein